MPCIITSIHDPVALVATCRLLDLPVPQIGCIQLDNQEVSGWIVRLSGIGYPIVINTLTGLIAYHPNDNGFYRYACIMRYIHRCYEVQAEMRKRVNSSVLSYRKARKLYSPAQVA